MRVHNGIAVLETDTHISKWVVENDRLDHDQNMLPLVLKHIKPGHTVIDIGAYIGDHTIAYAKAVGRTGRVIAFEPNPEAYECLEYNMKALPQVELRKECVSYSNGRLTLIQAPENIGMTYIDNSPGGSESISIDSLNLDRLDFMKIDAEGFEYHILKGAQETIRKFKPIMLIEINVPALSRCGITNNDVYVLLQEYGYDYRNIYDGQSLYDVQLDLLCLPK